MIVLVSCVIDPHLYSKNLLIEISSNVEFWGALTSDSCLCISAVAGISVKVHSLLVYTRFFILFYVWMFMSLWPIIFNQAA